MKEQIIEIAKKAGEILMKYFQNQFDVAYKKDDDFDPVTTADKEADDFIRASLLKLFPDDQILSEENENIPSDYTKRIWMVDPLDGTKDFVKGIPGFAIHIGLWSAGSILFGLVYSPTNKKMYFAQKGLGAFECLPNREEKRIFVSSVAELSQARLITRSAGNDSRPLDELIARLSVLQTIEESSLKVSRIACGEAEAHLNTNFRVSKWDTLAPQIILEEAGGIMTNLDGQPLDYTQPGLRWERSYIATNSKSMLEQIIAVIS